MRFAWRVIAAVTLMMGAALVLLMNFDSVSAQMPGFSKTKNCLYRTWLRSAVRED